MAHAVTATRIIGTVVLIAAVCFLLPWWWGGTHPVMPGVDGCFAIRETESRIGCLMTEGSALIDEQGYGPALARLEAAADNDVRRKNDCHEAMHRVGRTKIFDDGINPATLNLDAKAREECADGLVHGALQADMALHPGNAADVASKLCYDSSSWAGVDSCLHGLGHSLMWEGLEVSDASETCWKLQDARSVRSCLDGLHMEVANRVPVEGDAGVALNSVCSDAPRRDLPFCYAQMAGVLDRFIKADLTEEKDSVDVCASLIPEDGIKQYLCVGLASFGVPAENLDRCLRIGTPMVAQYCASSVVWQAIGTEEGKATAAERCAALPELHWGCGGGYAADLVSKRTTTDSPETVARSCDALSPATVREGCVAWAMGCWPVELSSGYGTPGRCDGMVPQQWVPQENGVPIKSVFDPGYTS